MWPKFRRLELSLSMWVSSHGAFDGLEEAKVTGVFILTLWCRNVAQWVGKKQIYKSGVNLRIYYISDSNVWLKNGPEDKVHN